MRTYLVSFALTLTFHMLISKERESISLLLIYLLERDDLRNDHAQQIL